MESISPTVDFGLFSMYDSNVVVLTPLLFFLLPFLQHLSNPMLGPHPYTHGPIHIVTAPPAHFPAPNREHLASSILSNRLPFPLRGFAPIRRCSFPRRRRHRKHQARSFSSQIANAGQRRLSAWISDTSSSSASSSCPILECTCCSIRMPLRRRKRKWLSLVMQLGSGFGAAALSSLVCCVASLPSLNRRCCCRNCNRGANGHSNRRLEESIFSGKTRYALL